MNEILGDIEGAVCLIDDICTNLWKNNLNMTNVVISGLVILDMTPNLSHPSSSSFTLGKMQHALELTKQMVWLVSALSSS